jgi:hypothetical protein
MKRGKRILSMYARGMSTRDSRDHVQEIYGVEISPGLVSRVTDSVLEELGAWQSRPLERVYRVVYLDALVVKVRDKSGVHNQSIYLVVGVQADGTRDVLGLWIQATEGAKFWLTILSELRQRGVQDILVQRPRGGPDPRALDERAPLSPARSPPSNSKAVGDEAQARPSSRPRSMGAPGLEPPNALTVARTLERLSSVLQERRSLVKPTSCAWVATVLAPPERRRGGRAATARLGLAVNGERLHRSCRRGGVGCRLVGNSVSVGKCGTLRKSASALHGAVK